MKAYLAEAIGTFALIFVGVGAINNMNGDLLMVALAHGLTIAVMVSATAAISGGHLNPAVTFGLWVGKKISLPEMLKYWGAQLIGAVLAGIIATILFGRGVVVNGTPALRVDWFSGVAIEAILTFFLVFVVYGTGVDPRGPKIGGLAIGLTVALDIMVGGPLTGAAMNPARAFGPALASQALFYNSFVVHLVYWIGPLFGGGLAGFVYSRYLQE